MSLTTYNLLTIEVLKELAIDNNKKLIYNTQIGGYQIISGFNASEVEYPFYDDSGNRQLTKEQLNILFNYI